MQPAQPTPLAELVKSFAGLHQTQHQALMDLRLEQEYQFRLLVQAQEKDQQIIQSLLGWVTQWPVRLIPLLSGEAQVAAQQLPVANLLDYEDLKWAILQIVGRSPEQHCQRFCSVDLGDSGRPFMMAQQLPLAASG